MALYLDGQKIISGGGGSGGHTIVDNEGVSLEQRTNLQFNGAYSEDNSTDDTTEVNVVREMTKAEFEQLTDEEKTGFINITDITGGNDDRFQPIIYSEDEREIGVWADGKPLYEKTIYVDSFPNNTSKNLSTPVNLDLLIDAFGFMASTALTGYFRPLPFAAGGSNDVRVDLNAGTLRVVTFSDWSSYEGYLTIRYTKTTDTAGSGQWTPQGVPTHHYSTDEQIIGTWIDGSSLYEKTFDLTSVSLTNATWNSNILGTSGSNIKIRKFSGTFNITGGGSYINEPYADYIYFRSTTEYFTAVINDAGNDLNLRPQINGVTMTAGVCTIQYTKTVT